MPLKLSAIQPVEDVREITLDFGDLGTLEMTVDPNKFDLARQRALRKAEVNNDAAGLADHIFAVVESWDLEDDDGNVIPLDESGVDKMKLGTAILISRKMTEALGGPKAETSNESPPTSKTRNGRKSR